MVKKIKNLYLYAAAVLFVYMPFHIFLSQWLSTFTGGLEAWKVAKDVLSWVLLMLGSVFVIYYKKYDRLFKVLWAFLLVFTALHFVVLFAKDQPLDTGILASVYNTRLMWFVLIGYMLTSLFDKKELTARFVKCLLTISTVVCIIGLLQYVLPKDIMTHFGYSVERGVKPMFFIDDKPDFPRIMSTLRDPNSLGSFLILPIVILWSRLIAVKRALQKNLRTVGLLILHIAALFLTFSRSAWLGTGLAIVLYTAFAQKKLLMRLLRRYWYMVVGLVITASVGVYVLRDYYIVQNVLLHSDQSTKMEGSTSLHVTQIKKGLEGIAEDPEGNGPGTAGLVSVHNQKGGLLPENYFVQIGYEVGLLGLVIFIVWLGYIAKLLRQNYVFIAVFAGMLVTNNLLQIWVNEAVIASFFTLTGLWLGFDTTKTK